MRNMRWISPSELQGLRGKASAASWARAACVALLCCVLVSCFGCSGTSGSSGSQDVSSGASSPASSQVSQGASENGESSAAQESLEPDVSTVWSTVDDKTQPSSSAASSASAASADLKQRAAELRAKLDIEEDYRESFVHGDKPAKYQKYIVLHDTEGDGPASGVVEYWDGSGSGVAAHFVVNKDGSIVQCVKLDKIAHHAGFGDTGHNEKYGVEDESRDDKVGTVELGEGVEDYGMNSYSIGIEMVHVGGEGDYPEEQLEALDGLIAYIDAYFGKESKIIDHKAWRTGNSDTSEEFAEYLKNYQDHRTHE